MSKVDRSEQNTDWNETFQEDTINEPRLSQRRTYEYKTRSNFTLFKVGLTDQSLQISDPENLLAEIVSDSVDFHSVPMFIDYEKFSNPFLKYSGKDNTSKRESERNVHCSLEGQPTKATATPEVTRKEEAKPEESNTAAETQDVKTQFKVLEHQMSSPKEAKPIAVQEPESVVDQEIPDDLRRSIPLGTYYMADMKMAVDDDPRIDSTIAYQFKTHIVQNFQNLHEVLGVRQAEQPMALPKKPELKREIDKSKILLVLDIDETLVHVVRSHEKLGFTNHLKVQRPGFPVIDIKFNLRPLVREFLEEFKDQCNLAFMTASHRSYAEQMYDFLDPEKKLLWGVFHKDHCVNYSKGRSVKDLSVFDYPIERIILVDNFISAFALHPDNGIPILPFYEGGSDRELAKLAQFIKESVIGLTDVRPVLRDIFSVRIYHEQTDVRVLVRNIQEDFKLENSDQK